MTNTIGQRLKKARKSRNLTLAQVEEATRIRQAYLQALEDDDYSQMPSKVHARGFLRNYAQYLGMDLDQVLEELRAAQPETPSSVVFEGEQQTPTPLPPEIKPEQKAEEPLEDTPAEPFWQTWLRRAKSEVGEQDATEEPATVPQQSEAVQQEADREKAEAVDDTRPVTAVETEAGQSVEREAVEENVRVTGTPSPWIKLVERIKTRIPQKQPKAVSSVEDREEPQQKPEPEPVPVAEMSGEPAVSSQEIINEIGMQLRRRREMLSLTLDEIERHTKLRVEIMEALESGKFEEMSSPVQTRGMLANYAGFLDLEVDALLLRFADALQARHRERHPENPARRRRKPNIPENLPTFRSLIAGDVVFGVGMVLLLIGFSIWGISRVIALQAEQGSDEQAQMDAPSISEALIGTPAETVPAEVTLIPAEDTPIPGAVEAGEVEAEATLEIPTLAVNANVQINIVAIERSFLRVLVDGEVAFEGRTIPGNAYPFQAEQSIEILAGNGSALRVIYNQRDLGLLGGFGQIASYIYTADEIVTPTPAMSPTVTNTPFISPTPSITPTPTLTPSPTPTPADFPVDV